MSEKTPQDYGRNKITKDNILEYYKVPEKELANVFEGLKSRAESLGLKVVMADLSELTNVNDPKALEIKHDTCQSDGKTVYLHSDLKAVGGNVSRIYDLMHVGLGHGTQWAAGKDSGLEFYGDESWQIATKAYIGASEEDLVAVHKYEEEAGRLGLAHLRKALENVTNLNETTANNLAQMYSDYVRRDLNYIMDYYRTGEVVNFFENFEPNQPILKQIAIPENLKPVARENQCIPLIRLS